MSRAFCAHDTKSLLLGLEPSNAKNKSWLIRIRAEQVTLFPSPSRTCPGPLGSTPSSTGHTCSSSHTKRNARAYTLSCTLQGCTPCSEVPLGPRRATELQCKLSPNPRQAICELGEARPRGCEPRGRGQARFSLIALVASTSASSRVTEHTGPSPRPASVYLPSWKRQAEPQERACRRGSVSLVSAFHDCCRSCAFLAHPGQIPCSGEVIALNLASEFQFEAREQVGRLGQGSPSKAPA